MSASELAGDRRRATGSWPRRVGARALRRGVVAAALIGAIGAYANRAHAEELLIRGARVHTLGESGTLAKADVLIRDGRIVRVGADLTAAAGATVVEAAGRPLTPGLFAGLTAIGIEEVSAEASTRDDSLRLGAPAWEPQWRPEFDVTRAYNPRSVVVPVSRVEGLTWGLLTPGTGQGGALIAGQGAAITLDGRFDAELSGSRTLFVALGGRAGALSGGSRAAQYMLLDQAVAEARSAPPAGVPRLLLPAGRAALARFLDGGRWAFAVDRASDIRQVIALAKRYKIQAVLIGAAEGWLVADELASAKIPVLVNALDNLPESFDRVGARLDNAALLSAAGVRIAFIQPNDASHNARKIRQVAGNAVANGLPWDAALAGLTSSPAEIFGLAKTRGRIAAGQVADLVLWSGDPLEVTTVAERVWIGGSEMPMRSRQTELRDRYLEKLRRGEAR